MLRIALALCATMLAACAHAQQFPIAGKPSATVDAVYAPLAKAILDPDIKELFLKGGAEAAGMPPAEMARVAQDLYDRRGAVIREVGVQLDQ